MFDIKSHGFHVCLLSLYTCLLFEFFRTILPVEQTTLSEYEIINFNLFDTWNGSFTLQKSDTICRHL